MRIFAQEPRQMQLNAFVYRFIYRQHPAEQETPAPEGIQVYREQSERQHPLRPVVHPCNTGNVDVENR
jgi:hypothetical protein